MQFMKRKHTRQRTVPLVRSRQEEPGDNAFMVDRTLVACNSCIRGRLAVSECNEVDVDVVRSRRVE